MGKPRPSKVLLAPKCCSCRSERLLQEYIKGTRASTKRVVCAFERDGARPDASRDTGVASLARGTACLCSAFVYDLDGRTDKSPRVRLYKLAHSRNGTARQLTTASDDPQALESSFDYCR